MRAVIGQRESGFAFDALTAEQYAALSAERTCFATDRHKETRHESGMQRLLGC